MSTTESVSERDHEIENNVKNMNTDMAQMSKQLEKIRDIIFNNPDQKNLLDTIGEGVNNQSRLSKKSKIKIIGDEIIDLSQYEDSDDENGNTYNSREISDLIQNRISIKKALKNKQVFLVKFKFCIGI